MHPKTVLAIGLFFAGSLAQDYNATPSSSLASSTDSSVCDNYATDCVSATSTTPTASTTESTSSTTTTIPFRVTNTTSLLSNLSTTMITVSTSPTSYTNMSLSTPATSMAVPTSILVATGTPIVPSSGPTITSYKIVPPTATGTATTTPTTQSRSARNSVGISSVAFVVLGISCLLLA